MFASWKLPFLSTKFNISICGTSNYMENWKYNQSFISDPNEIRIQLNKIIILKNVEYYKEKRKAEWILEKWKKYWEKSFINSSFPIIPINRKISNLNSNFSMIRNNFSMIGNNFSMTRNN